MKNLGVVAILLFVCISKTYSQLPRVIEKDGRHTLEVDGKPFFILGAQAHNSSAWPKMLPGVWSVIDTMQANTLEIPIYWEQIEPIQDKFDFSLIDTLLLQARAHKVRLILLWFGTWKNGSNHYMPSWMKRDAGQYPNVFSKDKKWIDSPSPHSKATLDADKKAFISIMKYLKEADKQHTVIMMQVENEPGTWGSVRDYSSAAEKLFQEQVPAELMASNILNALGANKISRGNWAQVFGDRADEYFHAWSIARYIEQVAAAGKAIYPLPIYVNAALRDPLTNPKANSYESGGPTDNVIPIWKAAAPSIDLLAPDIYISGSDKVLKVLELYNRPDNALFVPESSISEDKVRYLYEVIARGGIGFSPFGIDNNGNNSHTENPIKKYEPFAREYRKLAPMAKDIAQWASEGKIKSIVEREDFSNQELDLGLWKLIIMFGGDGRGNAAPVHTKPVGKIMVVSLDANAFLLIGSDCHITFRPNGKNAAKEWQYEKVEEGEYLNGQFHFTRIHNGDETDWGGPGFGNEPILLRASLILR